MKEVTGLLKRGRKFEPYLKHQWPLNAIEKASSAQDALNLIDQSREYGVFQTGVSRFQHRLIAAGHTIRAGVDGAVVAGIGVLYVPNTIVPAIEHGVQTVTQFPNAIGTFAGAAVLGLGLLLEIPFVKAIGKDIKTLGAIRRHKNELRSQSVKMKHEELERRAAVGEKITAALKRQANRKKSGVIGGAVGAGLGSPEAHKGRALWHALRHGKVGE